MITFWVRWKKSVKLTICLCIEDVEGAQDFMENTGDNYNMVQMPFNILHFSKTTILKTRYNVCLRISRH